MFNQSRSSHTNRGRVRKASAIATIVALGIAGMGSVVFANAATKTAAPTTDEFGALVKKYIANADKMIPAVKQEVAKEQANLANTCNATPASCTAKTREMLTNNVKRAQAKLALYTEVNDLAKGQGLEAYNIAVKAPAKRTAAENAALKRNIAEFKLFTEAHQKKLAAAKQALAKSPQKRESCSTYSTTNSCDAEQIGLEQSRVELAQDNVNYEQQMVTLGETGTKALLAKLQSYCPNAKLTADYLCPAGKATAAASKKTAPAAKSGKNNPTSVGDYEKFKKQLVDLCAKGSAANVTAANKKTYQDQYAAAYKNLQTAAKKAGKPAPTGYCGAFRSQKTTAAAQKTADTAKTTAKNNPSTPKAKPAPEGKTGSGESGTYDLKVYNVDESIVIVTGTGFQQNKEVIVSVAIGNEELEVNGLQVDASGRLFAWADIPAGVTSTDAVATVKEVSTTIVATVPVIGTATDSSLRANDASGLSGAPASNTKPKNPEIVPNIFGTIEFDALWLTGTDFRDGDKIVITVTFADKSSTIRSFTIANDTGFDEPVALPDTIHSLNCDIQVTVNGKAFTNPVEVVNTDLVTATDKNINGATNGIDISGK